MASSRTCQLCTAEEAVLMLQIFTPGFVQLVGVNCVPAMAIGVSEAQGGVKLTVTPEWLAEVQAAAEQDPDDGGQHPDVAGPEEGTGEVSSDTVASPVPEPGPKSANGNGTLEAEEEPQPAEAESATADG